MRVVVVAGEPSGDRAIAAVLRALAGVEAFGFGGDAMARAGAELLAHVRDVSGMGLVEVLARAPRIATATASLFRAVDRRRPTHAILASWSVANARLGARLRARGVNVVWISPPEVWAWGRWRARSLAASADRFALTMPFEAPIWREVGADARYVGHPALDVPRASRLDLRARLGVDPSTTAIAILPGSRPAEVRALSPAFLDAARILRARRGARSIVVAAPDLPRAVFDRLRLDAHALEIPFLEAPIDDGAIALLAAFDGALVASGTASLECALAHVPPVVAYRMHALTFAIARRVVTTPFVALPNVVLGRAAFVERVQSFDGVSLARDLEETIDRDRRRACEEVEATMREGVEAGFGESVAALL